MRILFFLLFSANAIASDPRAVYNNRSGVNTLMENKANSAQNEFLKALETEPQEARLHLNLGMAYQATKDLDRALKEYQTALRFANNDEVKFYANFNAGQAASAKNIDLALRYYQQALKYRPDSIETKHNIELLFQSKNGGGGEGNEKDKDQKDDGEDKGQDRTNQQSNEPQPYKGKDLTPQDVQNILDELKNQDQKVRAKENSAGKDRSLDKDW